MSVKRSRPGNPRVRTGKTVGPDYAENRFRNPFNADVDEQYWAGEDQKTLVSPTETTVGGCGLPLREGYDKLWEGK